MQVADLELGAPSLLIMGEKDYILKFPGMEEYLRSDELRNYAPDLEIRFVPNGTHFVQEQFPEQVSPLIVKFLNRSSGI